MELMLDVVVEQQFKAIALVPPILIRMVHDPVVDEYALSCLERLASGAAPLSNEIVQLLQKRVPQTGFKQG
ncbi:MAG: hypothetical protein M1838_001891 [Thelocarpon superellum]|nr:MAG: hypothetical protein M1838_001891 [Thelocarpon superellum]